MRYDKIADEIKISVRRQVLTDSNNALQHVSSGDERTPEVPATFKTWHKPVISRIEIAQTLGATGPQADQDGGEEAATS